MNLPRTRARTSAGTQVDVLARKMSGVIARAIGASVVGTLAGGASTSMTSSALKSSFLTVDFLPRKKGVRGHRAPAPRRVGHYDASVSTMAFLCFQQTKSDRRL